MASPETFIRRLAWQCLQVSRVLYSANKWSRSFMVAKAPVKQIHPVNSVTPISSIFIRNYASKAKTKQKGKKEFVFKKKNRVGLPGPKPDFKVGLDAEFHEIPIIHIKATYNNTLAIIADHNGIVAGSSTGGKEGFVNSKKGTSYTGQVVGESIAKQAQGYGVSKVRVKLKGLGPGRQSSLKGILSTGLQVVSITDTTPVPFNGNKPKKQRRI